VSVPVPEPEPDWDELEEEPGTPAPIGHKPPDADQIEALYLAGPPATVTA